MKYCAHCGSADTRTTCGALAPTQAVWCVRCDSCGACGPLAANQFKAVDLWDERADDEVEL
jgi:hypothetical protein